MIPKEYDKVDERAEIGRKLIELATHHPKRTSRLLNALEAFVQRDTSLSCRVKPDTTAAVEVFMEPSRYELVQIPGPAALIRVDHQARTYEIVHIFDEYGSRSGQWNEANKLSTAAL